SDIRIQIQSDTRYQTFISKAISKEVLGYKMQVAALEDILQGKLWAYADEQRRKSKRQKDLADVYRLIEKYPKLRKFLPDLNIN
ncbi:MAG: nucleotidyl transferase AbiEii/AbiGii toxin family protein, partial [bacterium]|nr:nucleotidyl transferase AbiEii/AbiGii toxin family protein [bacterium]